MDSQMNFDQVVLTFIEERNEAVKEMLQRTSLLYHAVDASGATLLHYSARSDNENITQFLLEKGSNVNAQDSLGNSPLMNAVEKNNKAIIEILLNAGADISLLNDEKKSALHMLNYSDNQELYFSVCKICLQGFRDKCSTSAETAEKLIDAGIDLYLAAFSLDFQIIECMLELGSPVESMHPVRKLTAMHIAVRFDDLDSVKVLLKYGANAKALDADSANPLRYLYCRDYGHNRNKIEILRILLSQGVSATSCCLMGRFNINNVLAYGNREAIHVALQSKLDFTATDKWNGCTILYYLTINPNPGVIEELEELEESQVQIIIQYAAMNAVDKDQAKNVLLLAAAFGNVDMLRFLLSRGADIYHEVLIGATYYRCSGLRSHLQTQYDQCIELLLQHNADPQFVIVSQGQITTVFDIPSESNYLNRIKPVIAHLSLLEKLGKKITELTRSKINSNTTLNKYFNECRQLIGERIFGSITFFTLLTSNLSTMERYSNNIRLLEEIQLFNRVHEIETYHSYLHNTWQKRLSKVQEYKKIKHKVVEGICKIININENQVIIENIINHLDIRSIRQLALL